MMEEGSTGSKLESIRKEYCAVIDEVFELVKKEITYQDIYIKFIDTFQQMSEDKQGIVGGSFNTPAQPNFIDRSIDNLFMPITRVGPVEKVHLVNMGIVYFIALVEGFCRDVLELYLIDRPERMISDSKLTYKDVIGYTSIQELYKHLAIIKVDKKYRNVESLQAWLKKILDINKDFGRWNEFKEIHDRRHCIVHNRGIVDKSYLDKHEDIKLILGEKFPVNLDYLIESKECIKEFFDWLVGGLITCAV